MGSGSIGVIEFSILGINNFLNCVGKNYLLFYFNKCSFQILETFFKSSVKYLLLFKNIFYIDYPNTIFFGT